MSVERMDLFTPRLTATTPDDVLQDLVVQAGRVTAAPVALISLVLEHIQLFRAQVGLPEALAVSRATSACDSFCQFVVEDEAPLAIDDALLDYSLPQNLVERLGVRAYLGYPLRVSDHVVGSLCVLDSQPRDWDDTCHVALEHLAGQVSERLETLFQQDQAEGRPGDRRAAAELGSIFRVIEAEAEGRLCNDGAKLALAVLEQPLETLRAFQQEPALHQQLQQQFGEDTTRLLARVKDRFMWADRDPLEAVR